MSIKSVIDELKSMEREYRKKAYPRVGFNFNTEKEQAFNQGVLYGLEHAIITITRGLK